MKTPALAFAVALLFAELTTAQTPVASAESKDQVVKTVTPDEASKLMNQRKDVVVLDVRTADEYAEGHIAGSKNLSFTDPDFKERLKEFEGKPVIVHCAAGNRSAKAVDVMKLRNFPEIHHLEKGFKGWTAAGKEVVKSPAATK